MCENWAIHNRDTDNNDAVTLNESCGNDKNETPGFDM